MSLFSSPWGMAWKASFVGANTVKVPGLFRFSVRPADWIAATNVLQNKEKMLHYKLLLLVFEQLHVVFKRVTITKRLLGSCKSINQKVN